jgi:chemotaxis protein methyltransferase CheR
MNSVYPGGEGLMNKLMSSRTILEHELSELRLVIERQTGLVLVCPNSALAARVAETVEALQLDSVTALVERFRSTDDATMLGNFLEALAPADTGFLRHHGPLNALTRCVLPQLFSRKTTEGHSTLRIWSAGCGTGEEPYSIAMAVCDGMPGHNGSNQKSNGSPAPNSAASNGIQNPSSEAAWSVHIVGSDLVPQAVAAAERGVYPHSSVAGLPSATIRSCFSKVATAGAAKNGGATPASAPGDVATNGESYVMVKPRLRSLMTFNTMNLARPTYIGRFDCIFCMDVLPHFSRPQKLALIERLHLYLEPGGYLFLGTGEKLIPNNLNFRSECHDGYTFYRKPVAAGATFGR